MIYEDMTDHRILDLNSPRNIKIRVEAREGGYSLIRAQWGRVASQGMFFEFFVLNRVSNLSVFVLIKVSIYQFLS